MNEADRAEQATLLLRQLTQCPEVARARADRRHACSQIVHTQPTFPEGFQVPEPWAGHLYQAPLLFVGSNPSIDRREPYPDWTDQPDAIGAFFDGRFGGQPGQVKDGIYFPLREQSDDGSWHARRPVAFWSACKRNAAWLYGRPVPDITPGMDYAMSEVVHCKSRSEIGVAKARPQCVQRWLEPMLAASPAPVVVLLGQHAELAFAPLTGPMEYWSTRQVMLGGLARTVLLARHPNYRGLRKWADHISPATRMTLHDLLAARREEMRHGD